ncbi:MAG: hypothetical protein V4615_05215 [Bacteroidota bacterium]
MEVVEEISPADQAIQYLELPVLQANELRLGNLICHVMKESLGFAFERVYSLGEHGINNPLNIPNAANQPFYRGLPLTPQLLERFGFEQVSKGALQVYQKREGRFNFQIVRDFKRDEYYFEKAHFNHVFYHFHQLQNLYFALTGEELEINLPNETPTRTTRYTREQVANFTGDIPKINGG